MAKNFLSYWREGPLSAYATLFDEAPVKMHAIDKNGILVDVSQFWADSLGYARDEMRGRSSTEFLTEDSRQFAKEVVLPKFFEDGRISDVEYDFVRSDGSILPVLMSAVAQTDEEGNFLHSLAVMFDNSEARMAAALLAQKHRMEAVGRLVGGVAHDFNNILMVIRGNLEFLQADITSHESNTYLDDALSAARRGSHLVRQLMSYGRRVHLSPRRLDLNVVMRETDSMLRRLIPENTVFETIAFGGLWTVRLDRSQLETAVLNLLNNAKDAMEDGGVIEIETANVELDADFFTEYDENPTPGRYVMLSIKDQGEGMDADALERAFEPFFTTKPVGLGSGLGLSMVEGFVRQSKGAVRLDSTPGEGTRIRMYFPAVEGAPEEANPEIQRITTRSEEQVDVLVVEDEDAVRRVLVRQLSQYGLRLAEAETGDAALELLRSGYKPKLIVTDIVMPGQYQGRELGREAKRLLDDVKVLYISGYPKERESGGTSAEASEDTEGQDYLLKPIQREDLIAAVKALLEDD